MFFFNNAESLVDIDVYRKIKKVKITESLVDIDVYRKIKKVKIKGVR